MNEYEDPSQQPVEETPAQIPSWQEVQQTPEFQTSKPEDKLVAFSRWHDAAYNVAQTADNWAENKDEFNRQAAETQAELSKAAGGIDPDMARLKVAMDHVKDTEAQLGRPLTDDEKSQTVQELGPDVAKAYSTPPSVYSRLMRPVTAFGEGFAGGLGQTLQTLGYMAERPGSLVTKLENKLFGTPTQEEVMKKFTGTEHPMEWLGKRIQTAATEPEAEADLDPRTKGGISEAVGHTAGGMLEFLGETALGGSELKALGLTKQAAGKVAAMGVFGIHNAAEGINHAREAGATEDQVLGAALSHAAIGAGTAAITPFGKWFDRLNEATGGGLKTTAQRALTEGGQFAAQMFTQQFGNNVANRVVLGGDKNLLQDTFEQAKAGGITGVFASLVLASILHGPAAFKLPPSTKVTERTTTPTGQVEITAKQDAIDKINEAAKTSPQTANAAAEAVGAEPPVAGIAKAAGKVNLPAVTSPEFVQDTVNATKQLLQKPKKTPADIEAIKNGRESAMWEWARTNAPELRGAIHDAAGRDDFAARDTFFNQLRDQFRNSPEAAELGIKPTVEQRTAPHVQDLVDGKITSDEFADKVANEVAEESAHAESLPKRGTQVTSSTTLRQILPKWEQDDLASMGHDKGLPMDKPLNALTPEERKAVDNYTTGLMGGSPASQQIAERLDRVLTKHDTETLPKRELSPEAQAKLDAQVKREIGLKPTEEIPSHQEILDQGENTYWDRASHKPELKNKPAGTFIDTASAKVISVGNKHYAVPVGLRGEVARVSDLDALLDVTNNTSDKALLHSKDIQAVIPAEVERSSDGWKIVKKGSVEFGESKLKGSKAVPKTDQELDDIVAEINRQRQAERAEIPRSASDRGQLGQEFKRPETLSVLTPEDIDKLRSKTQGGRTVTPKAKAALTDLGYTEKEIGNFSGTQAADILVNAQQGTAEVGKFTRGRKLQPKIQPEGGITSTKSRAELVQEYNTARAKEDARVAGAKEVSPGKAIGRSPAEIEREIIVQRVRELQAQAKEANQPFNVREAVLQAKLDFENHFKTDAFNPFEEPGEAEYARAHEDLVKEYDDLVKQGKTPTGSRTPTKGAVAMRAIEIKAAQKTMVKPFVEAMREKLADPSLTPEQRAEIGTEFVRRATEIEGTTYQNRTQQAEHYVNPNTEEYKKALEDTIEANELKQGFPSVTDSRGYSKGLGNSRAKALWERIHQKLAELYPAEPTPNAKGVELHKKNVWAKPGGEKTEKVIETSTGKFKTIRVGKTGFELITEGQSPITGDSLYVLEHKPTGRTRYQWTGDPRITVQQMARENQKGDHLFVPDSIPSEKISPAIHIATDPLTGKRYVESVDTVFGNITETGKPSKTTRTLVIPAPRPMLPFRELNPDTGKYEYKTRPYEPGKEPPRGRPTVETRTESYITRPFEFEQQYDQKIGRFQKAQKGVSLDDQAKIDFLNQKFNEDVTKQPATAPEEEGAAKAQPTGTLADIWPDRRGSQVAEAEHPDYETGEQSYREEEAYPTSYETMMDAIEELGVKQDNIAENVHLGDKPARGVVSGNPTSSADLPRVVRENLSEVKRLGLDDKNEPILNALRTIATSDNAAQRQLAKDLLANNKINWNRVKFRTYDGDRPDQFDFAKNNAAYYSPDQKTIFVNTSRGHDGGIQTSVLHELVHHIADAKLEPEYRGNAVEERVKQQYPKLVEYARNEMYKLAHDGTEGTKEQVENWSEEQKTADDQSFYSAVKGELFSEALGGNPRSLETLSKIPAMPGYKSSGQTRFANFLEQVINAIKSLFTGKNVTKGSLYDQVVNEALLLTREGEFNPERLIPRLAAETAAQASKSSAPTQEETNSTLEQMNRAQLEEAVADHGLGLSRDALAGMTQAELREALGYKATLENLRGEQLGEGYGGWLAKDGTYHSANPIVDTGSSGHGEAARIILENLEGTSQEDLETPVPALQKRGYLRIVNDHYEILVDGTPTDKQRKLLIDTGAEQGKAVTVTSPNPPYKTKTIYNPREVFARAGTPQGTNPNPNPNVSWRKGVDLIVAGNDAANNIANRRGIESKIEVAQDFGDPKNLTPEQKQDMNAASLVRQAGGDRTFMAREMQKIQNSTKIDQAEKDKWLAIYQYGEANFDRLNDKVQNGMFNNIMKEQLDRLQVAGVPVRERDNYISQMVDKPEADSAGIWDFLTGTSGGAGSSKFFIKGRKFETFADAIAAGYLPKSEGGAHPLDISEITHRYVELTERLLQHKELEERLKNTNAFDGKPIIGATEDYTSAAGNTHTTIPRGYRMVQTGGKPLVVHKDYAPLFEYAYSDSNLPGPLRKTLGFIKRNTLMFDTFHVGRIMTKAAFYSKGAARFGYEKGLSILEYSDRAWAKALQNGEVTAEMDAYRNTPVQGTLSRRDIVLELEKAGANFGRVADNLYAAHASSIPYLKKFNPWVFQKLSRGAMAQTAVENFIRNMSRFGELGTEGNARRTAKEYNEVFGNLQSQRIFKSKFYKNALDAVALAPNWAESQLLAEGRGIAQIGRAVYDTARGKPRLGTVAQGQLSVVLGMLAANQVLNYIARGHSTFENKEEGHKLDAFIPSLSGEGRGFWFNPFEIGAEYTHALHKYISQHQTPVDAASQIAKNKLNPMARGATELLSGRDYAGRRFVDTKDRVISSALDAAPLPLGSSGVIERDPRQKLGFRASVLGVPLAGGGVRQPDAGEKQFLQSVGLKVANKQTPRSEVFALAYPFRNDKSYTDNAGEYTELRRALDNNNTGAAESELRLLVSRGHTERQLKAAVGMSPTGHVAPENFTGSKAKEPEFRKALTPDQLQIYKEAQRDHVANAKKFITLFKTIRPDLIEALKANDKARR